MTRQTIDQLLKEVSSTPRPFIIMMRDAYKDSDFLGDDDLVSRTAMDGKKVLIACDPFSDEEDMCDMMQTAGMYTGQ